MGSNTYILKIYDKPIARFEFVAQEGGPDKAINLEIDPRYTHLMPMNIISRPTDEELGRFLGFRRIPRNRKYVEAIMLKLGLAPNDVRGIIDIAKGVSVNDAYSILPEDKDEPFDTYNLFDNKFDDYLAIFAYTGIPPEGERGKYSTTPELSTQGRFPKAWRRINEKLHLFKAGNPEPSFYDGREPFSEYLSSQLLMAAGINATQYELTDWHDMTCTTCELFNNKDISFVSFAQSLDFAKSQTYAMNKTLAFDYLLTYGEEVLEDYKTMAAFDTIIVNTDRHTNNFGFLRDNKTGEVIGFAPSFDYNLSLFTTIADTGLTREKRAERLFGIEGTFDIDLKNQLELYCGDRQREAVKRLVDFEFQTSGYIDEFNAMYPYAQHGVSKERISNLNDHVELAVSSILGDRRHRELAIGYFKFEPKINIEDEQTKVGWPDDNLQEETQGFVLDEVTAMLSQTQVSLDAQDPFAPKESAKDKIARAGGGTSVRPDEGDLGSRGTQQTRPDDR